MVQFNLPDNSKLVEGEHYASKTKSDNIKNFRVYRWSPDDEKNPRVDTYEVDMDNCGPMVLDAVMKIKSDIENFLKDNVQYYAQNCADLYKPLHKPVTLYI